MEVSEASWCGVNTPGPRQLETRLLDLEPWRRSSAKPQTLLCDCSAWCPQTHNIYGFLRESHRVNYFGKASGEQHKLKIPCLSPGRSAASELVRHDPYHFPVKKWACHEGTVLSNVSLHDQVFIKQLAAVSSLCPVKHNMRLTEHTGVTSVSWNTMFSWQNVPDNSVSEQNHEVRPRVNITILDTGRVKGVQRSVSKTFAKPLHMCCREVRGTCEKFWH